MKKIILSCSILLLGISAFSQHIAVNAFGGYTFRDKMNFGNAYAYLNGGGMWGASVEGINARGSGIEVLYQYQSTKIPVYGTPGNTQLNAGNDGAVVSYLLLNLEQYYINNPKIQPYIAAGLGAAFYKGDYAGSTSETKFAWDLKAGVKLNAGSGLGIKIGAQLLTSPQATGNAFFLGYPGVVYQYTTYATILQFGFTGGLVYSFGGK